MALEFKRHVEDDLIKELKDNPLWGKLKADCEKGEVFLALRNTAISFYHKGGRLFTFDGKDFITNKKFASVINAEDGDIKERQLEEIKLIKNFLDGYNQIKKNCELYSGDEAKGVSYLYQKSSYLSDENYVVLDIEIVLKDDSNEKDRIDILLYDKKSQTLRFVEAKHFSNPDLWSKSTPKVIEQIKNYEKQIKDFEKGSKLVEEYGFYIDNLSKIFDKKLPSPGYIDQKISLLIFGFDDDQKYGKLKESIFGNSEYKDKDIKIYPKGHADGLKAETIWEKAK